MIFRIICGVIIVTGFTYFGYLYSEKQKDRLRQLSSFCDGLSMLEFNIRYMNFPMSVALSKSGESCSCAVKEVFKRAAEILGSEKGYSPGEAFCQGLEENKARLNISKDEIEILKSFSSSLGEGDKNAEITNISAAKTRLLASGNDAKDEINKKAKASRGISPLIGLFIVIVLF